LHRDTGSTCTTPDSGSVAALTSNYVKMLLPEGAAHPNTILDVRVTGIDAGQLLGIPSTAARVPV
jgi:hypothetical protein